MVALPKTGGFMKTLILALILFCVMIFPHELGHFIAAKRMGVRVNEFAFGMGPTIWKKQGPETLYSIRLFPVGGFCAMEGEDGEDETEEKKEPSERSFARKKPWQKIVILVAGSFMNVICAALIMIIVVGAIGFTTTTIDTVAPDSPAALAGVEPGDAIYSISGTQIEDWSEISAAIGDEAGKEISVIVEREGQKKNLDITPEKADDGRLVIGITCRISHSPFKAIVEGTKATGRMTLSMFQAVADIFKGNVGADQLSGPVGMVQMVNETSRYGLWYYGFLTSMICMNLAIVNLLPLPALDGGRIIFVIISMITGKPISERIEGSIHFAGILLLLGLMVYVTFNDVTRIFG